MIVCPFSELGRYAAVIPGLEEALAAVKELTDLTPRTVPLSGSNKILVQSGTTKAAASCDSEAHRKFLDIQYIVKGSEIMGWAPVDALTPADEFNEAKDKGMYAGSVDFIRITAGNCYVVYPEDAHMPGVHLDQPTEYTKLVIKLAV